MSHEGTQELQQMRGSLMTSSLYLTERVTGPRKRLELPQDRAASVLGVGGAVQERLFLGWEHKHRKALIAMAPKMSQPPFRNPLSPPQPRSWWCKLLVQSCRAAFSSNESPRTSLKGQRGEEWSSDQCRDGAPCFGARAGDLPQAWTASTPHLCR